MVMDVMPVHSQSFRVSGRLEKVEKKEPMEFPSARPAGYAVSVQIDGTFPDLLESN